MEINTSLIWFFDITSCHVTRRYVNWYYLEVLQHKNKEIKKNRKEYTDDTQELLFVAFYTHGVQGHVMDDTKTYIQYEVILDILNETLDLRIMPKVKPL